MTREQFLEDVKNYVSKPVTKEMIERTLNEINKSETLYNSTLKSELLKDLRGVQ